MLEQNAVKHSSHIYHVALTLRVHYEKFPGKGFLATQIIFFYSHLVSPLPLLKREKLMFCRCSDIGGFMLEMSILTTVT